MKHWIPNVYCRRRDTLKAEMLQPKTLLVGMRRSGKSTLLLKYARQDPNLVIVAQNHMMRECLENLLKTQRGALIRYSTTIGIPAETISKPIQNKIIISYNLEKQLALEHGNLLIDEIDLKELLSYPDDILERIELATTSTLYFHLLQMMADERKAFPFENIVLLTF